jgi:hypothetical protein
MQSRALISFLGLILFWVITTNMNIDIEDIMMPTREAEGRQKPIIPEKHLQNPIITTIIPRLKDVHDAFFTTLTSREKQMKDPRQINKAIRSRFKTDLHHSYSGLLGKINAYTECLIENGPTHHPAEVTPDLYPHLLTLRNRYTPPLGLQVTESDYVADIELKAYRGWVNDILKPTEAAKLEQKLRQKTVLSEETLKWWEVANFWDCVVEKGRERVQRDNRTLRYNTTNFTFCYGQGYCIIADKSGLLGKTAKWGHIVVWEQLQMLQDIARARFNVHLAIDMGMHNGSEQIGGLISWLFKWQDLCLTTYSNDGYNLVKAPEALMKTYLTTLTDGDIIKPSSFDRTVDKIKSKESEFNPTSPLITKFTRFIRNRVTNIGDACELYGMAKMAGHPAVYAKRSGAHAREAAAGSKHVTAYAILQLHRTFRHNIIEAHIEQHDSWPTFEIPPAEGTKLRRYWIDRSSALPLSCIDLSDLDHITFAKMRDFDYHCDYLDYMEDKAICPGASETPFFWFSEEQMGRKQEKPRRLLTEALSRDIDCKAIVERLRRGGFELEEMVVELTQKEREFKMAARTFAKMVFEVRLYWLILESNLKALGKDLMPSLTMTMSEADEKKRLFELVHDFDKPNTCRLEIDFSDWNRRWYWQTNKMISQDLEDLHGMPGAWSQFFWFMNHATVLVMDKNYLPPGADPKVSIHYWPESEVVIRGWDGGQEGIQQYLWSWMTVCMCNWALSDQPVSYKMAGQGDNHIFALTFTLAEGDTLELALSRLLVVLELRTSWLNHEVKPEECIDSKTVLTYSKEVYVRGAHQMYSLKFASRSFARSDKEIPSLTKEIASIAASSQAVADCLKTPVLAVRWMHAQIRIFFLLRQGSPIYYSEKKILRYFLENRSRYLFLSLLPGSLGGLPVAGWTRYFMKGEVDDLSWDVASYCSHRDTYPIIARDLWNLEHGEFSPKTPNLTDLLNDPTSIPILRPSERLGMLKDATERHLRRTTKNSWIKQLFDASMSSTALKEALAQSKPFFPHIMSSIFDLSPQGVKEKLLGRFNMTRTVSMYAPDISKRIEQSNVALLEFIKERYTKAIRPGGTDDSRSAFNICQKLRDLWKCDLHNADIGVYTPFEFKLGVKTNEIPWISATLDTDITQLFDHPGAYPPLFGSKTKAKVSTHGYKIHDDLSAVRDLKNLILLNSQLGDDPTLRAVIDSIVSARCPWTVGQLSSIMPTSIGGCSIHRHQEANSAVFAVLGSKTVPSHVNFCSDDAGKLSGGLKDYPVIYQAYYLTLASVASGLADSAGIVGNRTFGLLLTDEYDGISEDPVVAPPIGQDRVKVDFTGNDLIYVNELSTAEMPQIPDKRYLSMVSTPESNLLDLTFSYFMYALPQKFRVIKWGPDIVDLPIDLMDFKEFLILPLDVIEDALCCYNIAYSIKDCTCQLNKWKTTLSKASDRAGSLLARMLAHPLAHSLKGNDARKYAFTAGRYGGRASAQKLSDILYDKAMKIMEDGRLQKTIRLLTLPTDIGRSRDVVLAYTYFVMTGQKHKRGSLTSLSNTQLQNMNFALGRPDIKSLNELAARARTAVAGMNQLRGKHNGLDCPRPRFAFTNLTPPLLIRQVRTLPVPDAKPTPLPQLPPIQILRKDEIIYVRVNASGKLLPLAEGPDPNNELHIKTELYLQSERRKYGEFTGILTDWLAALAIAPKLFRQTTYCIGVGEGGSSTAAILRGAPKVLGIDLREAFPKVTGREATYKPAEIVKRNLDSRFQWDESVWNTGGDVLDMDRFPSGDILVDLDLDQDKIPSLQKKMQGTGYAIWRVTCTEVWLRTILSTGKALRAYNFSLTPNLKKRTYIIMGQRDRFYRADPNFDRVTLSSQHQVQYECTGRSDGSSYIANLLKMAPESLSGLDKVNIEAGIEQALGRLTGEITNPNERSRQINLSRLIEANDCREAGRLDLLALSGMSNQSIRILGRLVPLTDGIRTSLYRELNGLSG